MAVSNAGMLKGIHDDMAAIAAKAVSSDFTAVIKGFEQYQLLTNKAPWAVLTPGEPMEIPGPMGTASWQPSQVKTHMQGAMSFLETENGMVDNMLIALLASGGQFEMTLYEGTPDKFSRGKKYRKCTFVAEPLDRDWESRSQPMIVEGTLFFHYFGEDIDGNVESLSG
jgi:hypothetical protein